MEIVDIKRIEIGHHPLKNCIILDLQSAEGKQYKSHMSLSEVKELHKYLASAIPVMDEIERTNADTKLNFLEEPEFSNFPKELKSYAKN
jgi:hypothetical protein